MLGDQGSPYVGRFARGWHRLPGVVPGQPQTRTRARTSIGRSTGAQERPCSHQQRDARRSVGEQNLGARGGGRSRGEHVVDEEHMIGHDRAFAGDERSAHRRSACLSIPSGLRTGRDDPAKQPSHRKPGLPADSDREHPRLIEPPLGLPSPGQRHPCHDVGSRWNARRHRRAERPADTSHPSVLEVMDRGSSRSLERERRPGPRDLLGWTLGASGHLTVGGRGATSCAPRRPQRMETTGASLTERPCGRAAPRAARREDDIERPGQHEPTIGPGCDTRSVRADRSRSADRPRER
jgi:hypothetical protein